MESETNEKYTLEYLLELLGGYQYYSKKSSLLRVS